MSSCLLFHGPGAQAVVLLEAEARGRMLCPPVGGEGLTIDAVREVVLTLQSTPVGDQQGVLVIGPVDRIRDKSGDALLKSMEEINTARVQPLLWANDIAGVAATLRSRCLTQWCPGEDVEESQEGAEELVEALLAGNLWRVYEIPQKWLGREPVLLNTLVEKITAKLPVQLPLWERLRALTVQKSLTAIELVETLLNTGEET